MSENIFKVAFVSQSGSVMKSTIVQAVAVLCEKMRLECLVADLDKEHRTTSKFIEQRNAQGITEDESTPGFKVLEVETAKNAISNTPSEGIYLIDAPSRANEATFYLAKNVDKIILPTPTGLKDLELTIETACQIVDSGINSSKLLFILTRVGSDFEYNEAKDFIESVKVDLDPKYDFEVLKYPLFEKIAYRSAITNGFTILETSHASINKKAERAVLAVLNKILGD